MADNAMKMLNSDSACF